VVELSRTGAEVARARDEILRQLQASASATFQPQELIRHVAGDHDRDPYRAALMSLLASGVLERADGWTIRLSSAHASTS
jgi:hypothetical protein